MQAHHSDMDYSIPAPDYGAQASSTDTYLADFNLKAVRRIRSESMLSTNAWELTFELPEEAMQQAKVQPGMQIGLIPENDRERVDALLPHLKKDPKDRSKAIEVTLPTLGSIKGVKRHVSHEQAVSHLLDMTRPSEALLSKLEVEASEWERCKLQPLEDFLADHSGEITLQELLHYQPDLKNRKYTPSEVDKQNNTISIMFSEVHETGADGERLEGTTTRQLRHLIDLFLEQGVVPPIRGCVDTRKEKLPYHRAADAEAPVILVSTGVGVAPHIAMLRDAKQQSEDPKVALMISGGKTKADELAADEIAQLLGESQQNYRYVASREPQTGVDGAEIKYVQHQLWEERDTVWDVLENQKGHVYLCGLESMEEAVMQTLQAIAQEKLPNKEAADAWMGNLSRNQIHASTSGHDRFFKKFEANFKEPDIQIAI